MTKSSTVSDAYRFVIDPEPVFFRIFCGRVVKRDPVTGIEYLVPFATADAQDAGCHLVTAGTWPPATAGRGRGCRRRFQLRS